MSYLDGWIWLNGRLYLQTLYCISFDTIPAPSGADHRQWPKSAWKFCCKSHKHFHLIECMRSDFPSPLQASAMSASRFCLCLIGMVCTRNNVYLSLKFILNMIYDENYVLYNQQCQTQREHLFLWAYVCTITSGKETSTLGSYCVHLLWFISQ